MGFLPFEKGEFFTSMNRSDIKTIFKDGNQMEKASKCEKWALQVWNWNLRLVTFSNLFFSNSVCKIIFVTIYSSKTSDLKKSSRHITARMVWRVKIT